MNRRRVFYALAALPLAAVGWVYARPEAVDGFVCPLNGDVLPCKDCCPIEGATGLAKPRRAANDCCLSDSECCAAATDRK